LGLLAFVSQFQQPRTDQRAKLVKSSKLKVKNEEVRNMLEKALKGLFVVLFVIGAPLFLIIIWCLNLSTEISPWVKAGMFPIFVGLPLASWAGAALYWYRERRW
jgi:membrane protein CcdC involved in cytochrome C biogenesis